MKILLLYDFIVCTCLPSLSTDYWDLLQVVPQYQFGFFDKHALVILIFFQSLFGDFKNVLTGMMNMWRLFKIVS